MTESFNYEKHSKLVRAWGKKHRFPLPPKQMLPAIGYVVNEAACGFLYLTDSKIALLEWVFGNPEKTKEERAEALDVLFSLLEKTAKELKYEMLFTMAGTDAYRSIVERNGFEETDKNVTHHIKFLGE